MIDSYNAFSKCYTLLAEGDFRSLVLARIYSLTMYVNAATSYVSTRIPADLPDEKLNSLISELESLGFKTEIQEFRDPNMRTLKVTWY